MKQVGIKIIYIFILLIFYFIGQYLDLIINETYNFSLDLKLLLPIINLVFYEDWLRLFKKYSVKWKTSYKYGENCILIINKFIYNGKDNIIISNRKISGIVYCNPEIIFYDKGNLVLPYPTNESVNLGPNNPSTKIGINLKFKRYPNPRVVIPFIKRQIFIVKLQFKINNSIKRKTLIIQKRLNNVYKEDS